MNDLGVKPLRARIEQRFLGADKFAFSPVNDLVA